MNSRKKIAVIGSGFGGLSAAIRLAAAGHQVSIFEKLDKPGGRAYQYEINGFSFDAGPTVITAPHQYDELFEAAGKKRDDYFQLVPLDPFYRIFNGTDSHFNYWRDAGKAEAEVSRFSPGDLDGYRRFIEGTKNIFEWFHPFTEKSFPNLGSFAKIFPHVLTTGTWRTMYDYAAHFVKDDFIRKVCSFHPLLVGGNPFDTPSIYGLIIQFEKQWGVHYAMGGTSAIVRGLEKLFYDCGGTIHYNSEVREIIVKQRKACGLKLSDNSTHPFDEVICNGDITHAHNHLLPRDQVPAYSRLRLNRMEYSNSLVVVYFGTNRRYNEGKLTHHNLILGDPYRKLMKDIFRSKVMPANHGLYIHMPSLTDPTIAPEGCESFYALSLVPNLDGKIDWEEIMPSYTDKLMGFLEESYLPGLRSHVVAQHAVNPLHFKQVLNAHKGAAFSIKPSMMQSGYFRPQVRSKYIKNLYFVGAGVHPGAGVPAVMASGKIAAQAILEQPAVRLHGYIPTSPITIPQLKNG